MNEYIRHITPMVLAAGLGTRLGKFTESCPKALVKVGSNTLLEIILNKLRIAGFNSVIINVHHFADQIISYLKANNNFGMTILISDESDKLMDTGGALLMALPLIPSNNQLLVHNVDVISSIDLNLFIRTHLTRKACATLAVRDRKSSRKLVFGNDLTLEGWINTSTQERLQVKETITPNAKLLAFNGIHLVDPGCLRSYKVYPRPVINMYLELAKTQKVIGFFDHSDTWYDLGKAEQLIEFEKKIK